jgi:hypothetical protein
VPESPVLAGVDRALRTLPQANIAFNAPTSLRLGDTAVLQLLLSLNEPVSRLQKAITEVGKREGARIRVSNEMEARLTGAGFEIEPITPERQAVSGFGTTQWEWEIRPKKAGTYRLHLTLSALIDLQSGRSTRAIRTFDRTLKVDVSLGERVSRFFDHNFQWLLTAILIPLLIWIGKRWMGRSKRSGEDKG